MHRAGFVEGTERRWNPLEIEGSGADREAERDTTGSISRQPPLHTLNGPAVQGKRRRAATVTVIHRAVFKLQLTLRFYCGKRIAGGPVFNICSTASGVPVANVRIKGLPANISF